MADTPLQVSAVDIPCQQEHQEAVFPLALACDSPSTSVDDVVAWTAPRASDLLSKLERHGAILFRGFPLGTAEDFDRFIAAFALPNFSYDESLSNAVRANRTPRVFTANEAPPSVAIMLHHEMAQTPVYPSKLFFFCERPAEQGGATPICRSDVLWERLVAQCPEFARSCSELGLRYTNVMPPADDSSSGMGRSWQSTLRAETVAQAEQRLQTLEYSWQWLPDGCLRATTPVLPAVRRSPSGRDSFFNQLIAAYGGWKDRRNDPSKAVTFGDGTPLDRGAMSVAAELAESLTFDIAWQQGDVALVDNYIVMHGRRPFVGTRRVLASLVAVE
jgi:alpha-ketoglutarate-dependent taurine dioxygenase